MNRILILILISLFSCKAPPKEVKLLDKKDFSTLVYTNKNIQLIDVRTADEYLEGKIKNAVNIDFYSINFKAQLSHLQKNKPIAVYCKKGGRSAKAASLLEEMGFKEIYDLKGGFQSWTTKSDN